MEDPHHDGVFGDGVGFLEAATGDAVDDGVHGVLGPGGAVVEDAELEDLEEGGEGDGGGGGGDVVGLDDVEEGGEVDGGVDGAPFLVGVEDEGAERSEGIDGSGVETVVGGKVGGIEFRGATNESEDGTHFGV